MRFNYPYTAVRILATITVLMLVNARHISSLEDVIVKLGGAIIGSIVAEIVIRLIFKNIIKD